MIALNVREIVVRPGIGRLELEKFLGSWSDSHDAELKPMGRLVRNYRTAGEDMHWHITGRSKGAGTVEVTYLPSIGRLTVLVHDNRRGLWAGDAYRSLAEEVNRLFSRQS